VTRGDGLLEELASDPSGRAKDREFHEIMTRWPADL
jgi:hypothetical protein